MKQFSKELGKVSITPKGDWNSSITNERLDIVYDRRNNQAYIAKQDVPIDVDIDNREYWQPLNVSGYADNNFINLTAENENGTITAYECLDKYEERDNRYDDEPQYRNRNPYDDEERYREREDYGHRERGRYGRY